VFSSESVRRLRPVTIFGEFIGGANAHLNRDL